MVLPSYDVNSKPGNMKRTYENSFPSNPFSKSKEENGLNQIQLCPNKAYNTYPFI